MNLRDWGGMLGIYKEDNPTKPIILWTAGDHSSIMTKRSNGTDNWFGY